MDRTSTEANNELVSRYNTITKEHKTILKSLIKCGMCIDQMYDENIQNLKIDQHEKEINLTEKEIEDHIDGKTTASKMNELMEFIHKLHQENERLRSVFVQLWCSDIVTYQKLLEHEMTMLENTKIQFTRNFFNRFRLKEDPNVIKIYRKIVELFFISETNLICGSIQPSDTQLNDRRDFDFVELVEPEPRGILENTVDVKNMLKEDRIKEINQEKDSRFFILKTQIQTNINEIRSLSEQLENTAKLNNSSSDSFRNQKNMSIDDDDDDNESIESVENNFHIETDSMDVDIPASVENYFDKIKALQSVPISAKITGYRYVTSDTISPYNQFCVKIKVKHAFYEIWRRYNSFRKLHYDLSVMSPIKMTNISNESLPRFRQVVLEEYLNNIINLACEGKIGKFVYCKNNHRYGGPNLNQLHPFFDPQAQDYNII